MSSKRKSTVSDRLGSSENVHFSEKKIKLNVKSQNLFNFQMMLTRYLSIMYNSKDADAVEAIPTLVYHILKCFGVYVPYVSISVTDDIMPEVIMYYKEKDRSIHLRLCSHFYETYIESCINLPVVTNEVIALDKLAKSPEEDPCTELRTSMLCTIALADHIIQHILNDHQGETDPSYIESHPHDSFGRSKGTLESMIISEVVYEKDIEDITTI